VFTGGLYLFSKLFYSWSSCALLYFFGFSSDVIIYSNECELFHTVLFLSLFWRLLSTVVFLWCGRGGGGGRREKRKIECKEERRVSGRNMRGLSELRRGLREEREEENRMKRR
jgi:hypothetical protein